MVQTPANRPNGSPARGNGEDQVMQWRPGRLLAAVVVLTGLFIAASFLVR